MDVVDFPGVDDCDSVIQGLCKILFGLAQLVIYVVDYRFVNWGSGIFIPITVDSYMNFFICLSILCHT